MARQRRVRQSDLTILIVDDQEEVPRSLRGILEPLGYRVVAAESADAALALLARQEVDLLLVDQVMPGRSGAELIAEIRATQPHLPIILHTGYAGERPPLELVDRLGLQGYHDKADGPDKLLLWIAAAARTLRSLSALQRHARHHDEVLAEVSHELRAPLQCISGFADLLVEESLAALPEAAHPPLHAVARTAHRLNDLVSNCLTRAKLDARALVVSRRPVPIGELAEEWQDAAARLLTGTQVRFVIDRRLAPAVLHTDLAALRAIVHNLLGNAVERTTRGTITLFIAGEGDGARLAVADSGPGIDPDRLVEMLATEAPDPGSGGLALGVSRQLARLLGGDLTACSHARGGAVFTLLLPADGVPAEVGAPDGDGRMNRAHLARTEGLL